MGCTSSVPSTAPLQAQTSIKSAKSHSISFAFQSRHRAKSSKGGATTAAKHIADFAHLAADKVEDDPFADISDDDLAEADKDQPRAHQLPAAALSNIRLFAERESDSNEDFDEDDDGGSAVKGLYGALENPLFTYVGNKRKEIDQVKQQALNLKNNLNLFYNPSLVRALMEVLQAKEMQILRAREAGDISDTELQQLLTSLKDARATIARCVNSNTVRITRRVLRRTRSFGEIFERPDNLEPSTSEESSAPSTTAENGTAAKRSDASISLSDSSMHSMCDSQEGAVKKFLETFVHHSRAVTSPLTDIAPIVDSAAARGNPISSSISVPFDQPNASAMNNLLAVCMKESCSSALTSLKTELVSLAHSTRNPNLAGYIEGEWQRTMSTPAAGGEAAGNTSSLKLLALQAQLLDCYTSVIERYHPASFAFGELRRKVKEYVLALEVMELQTASHAKLEGRNIHTHSAPVEVTAAATAAATS